MIGTGLIIGKAGGQSWSGARPTELIAIATTDTNVDLTWSNSDITEIERSTDDITYTNIATTDKGVNAYSDTTVTAGTLYYYRARGKKGENYTTYWYSDSVLTPITDLLDDGDTVGHYFFKDADCRTRISSADAIYWDMNYGKEGQLDTEQASGNIVKYAVYKITACETDFFYTGNQVGDIFPCLTVKTCDSNNKVQRYLGNHLTQPNASLRAADGRFYAAYTQCVKTAPFTWNQPEMMYLIMKQVTWLSNKYIFDGNASGSAIMYSRVSSPKVSIGIGADLGDCNDLAVDTWAVVKTLFNNTNSKIQIDDNTAVTGTVGGAGGAGGFTLAASGGETSHTNIEVDCAILRKSALLESEIGTYLKNKKIKDYTIKYVSSGYNPSHPGDLYTLHSIDGLTWLQYNSPDCVYHFTSNKIGAPAIMCLNGTYYVSSADIQNASDITTEIRILSSPDLLNWTLIQTIDVSGGEAGIYRIGDTCWFVDDDDSVHLIVSASPTVNWEDARLVEIHATNAGLTTWSAPVWLTWGLGKCSDPSLIKVNDEYYMAFVDSTGNHVRIGKASNLLGDYTLFKDLSDLYAPIEGPSFTKIRNGWRMYVDYYDALPKSMYYSDSFDDLKTWSDPVAFTTERGYYNHMTICQYGIDTQFIE